MTVAVEGANRHDSKLLVATLEGLVVARPALGEEEEEAGFSERHFLCVDAAYDSEPMREELEARGYEPHTHISPADKEKRKKKRIERKEAPRRHPERRARRWVVE